MESMEDYVSQEDYALLVAITGGLEEKGIEQIGLENGWFLTARANPYVERELVEEEWT